VEGIPTVSVLGAMTGSEHKESSRSFGVLNWDWQHAMIEKS